MQDARLDKLAQVLVQYSVHVKRGDVVRISGALVAMPLIRAIYREILLADGYPLLRLQDDQCADLFYEHAKPHQLKYLSPLQKREIETIDCSIGIWADDNTKSMSRVDPRKQTTVSQARRPIMDVFSKRAAAKGKNRLRWVGTQYPCHAAAQDAEMSLAQYEDFVFSAGLLHHKNPADSWKKISVKQKRLCDFLNKKKEVHITTPQGTDIRFGVRGRTWVSCAGEYNFPDGEVFTGPLEDATEGVVCFSFPAVHGGREVQDVRLEFKGGKVVDATASKGESYFHKVLEQDAGAKIFGELAFGTNYGITEYSRNTLFDEKIGGTFHAALGESYPETGGRNKSGLHWDLVCDLRKGGVVKVDGQVISKNGKFVRKDWPQPVKG